MTSSTSYEHDDLDELEPVDVDVDVDVELVVVGAGRGDRVDHDERGTVSARRVSVLAGGRSSEHEVSLASGASVAEGLRTAGHDVTVIEIGRDGVWRRDGEALTVTLGAGLPDCDVVFPVLHGPFGEDGTVQGLLECLDVPYVGAGVIASAVCMDKIVFKELMAQAEIPQVDYRAVREADYRVDPAGGRAMRSGRSACRCSSSPRGSGRRSGSPASRARSELAGALETAFTHDSLAIVEAFAAGREVECSVIGNDDPLASQPGEILLAGGEDGWYDYEAKYSPGGMELIVPARLGAGRASSGSASWRSARSSRQGAPAWPGSTSSSSATRCSSTSSTRCRASRRRACSARCSRPAGSRIPSCWTGCSTSLLERHARERSYQY